MKLKKSVIAIRKATQVAVLGLGLALAMPLAIADEGACSPFTPLVQGQEDFVYVWTLGLKGMGDESDKLVTVDVNPKSKKYGKVINTVSVGGRGEAHHMGFTDDRRFMWAGALDSNKIFIFDVATDPSNPKLVKTITDYVEKSGLVGPHTFYATPGRMIIGALSNAKDHGGRTGMATYTNAGEYVSTTMMPTTGGGDGFGYDMGINPNKNVLLTTSFAGWNNYMADLGKLMKDPEAMKEFGSTSVMWDYKSMKPLKIFNTPGAPLEVRWSLKPGSNWAVTTAALTSKIYVYKQDDKGEWQQHDVGTIGKPGDLLLPVDIALVPTGDSMWVDTHLDGTARHYDMTDPMKPKLTYSKKIGSQVNMVNPSWDGSRVYFTTSLLGNWDRKGKDDEQFLKAYDWDGKELKLKFHIDFYKEKLGRAHHMKFQVRDLKTLKPLQASNQQTIKFAGN